MQFLVVLLCLLLVTDEDDEYDLFRKGLTSLSLILAHDSLKRSLDVYRC